MPVVLSANVATRDLDAFCLISSDGTEEAVEPFLPCVVRQRLAGSVSSGVDAAI